MKSFDITQRRLNRELKARKEAESIIENKSLELYNVNHQLINYSERLKQSNNDLEQFAQTVSHDLKSPLTRIKGLFGLLRDENRNLSEEEKEEYLSLVDSQILQMEELINEVLKYSQLQSSEVDKSRIDLNDIVEEVIKSIAIDSGITVKKNKLPLISANKTQCIQVFQNLIGNAIKYHDQSSGLITIDYAEYGQYYELSVTDDGPGIPKEDHTKIFELFGTSIHHKKVDSSGIGLATVKKIVTQNGGKVWVESQLGEGTKFIIQWPK